MQLKDSNGEYWEFPFFQTIVNWILFVSIWSLLTVLIIVYLNTPDFASKLGIYDNLFFLLFIFILGVLAIKQKAGNFRVIYEILFGQTKWYNEPLGNMHQYLFLLYFFLTISSRGAYNYEIIFDFSFILFLIGMILAYILLLKPLFIKDNGIKK